MIITATLAAWIVLSTSPITVNILPDFLDMLKLLVPSVIGGLHFAWQLNIHSLTYLDGGLQQGLGKLCWHNFEHNSSVEA